MRYIVGMPQYKIRTVICKGCGKTTTRRRPSGGQYCSLNCYRQSPRPSRKTGRVITCPTCGRKKYKPKAQLVAAMSFCSLDCANEYQRRAKVSYTCHTCGKTFKWSPSRAKQQNPKYCSIKCRTACPEWRRKAVIEGNLRQQNKKEPTRLELAGRAILKDIGCAFTEQVLVADKFTVDVVLDGLDIVIQWDGDYWHGFKRPLDKRQKRRVALDKSQDAYMTKCGYTVIRFWEHEVHHERDAVRAYIKKTIRLAAS